MVLWKMWFEAVAPLRAGCSRTRTFHWMVLCLIGLCIRTDLAGVTSLVRVLGLEPVLYNRLLHLFHSPAIKLQTLTEIWAGWCSRTFPPCSVGSYRVWVADGLKAPKEGRLMPAVKKLHQESSNNSKAEFIFGHSFQCISLLTRTAQGFVAAIPLAARICEGVIWSNRDKRSQLDHLVTLMLSLARATDFPVLLVADAYYATRKVILPLLAAGHHLVTRARRNAVAYRPAPKPKRPRRGRPRIYGKRLRLRDLFADASAFTSTPSPLYDDKNVVIAFRCIDLLWRPVGRLVRFVLVRHPTRGSMILMSSDITTDPLDIIILYSYRFKIELGFRQALHVLGTYAYHFWMMGMTPLRRVTGNQHMHHKSELYRQQVRRKLAAYHNYVQLGCIAQGLLLHLAIAARATVWTLFRTWLRTMRPDLPPSELVVAHALRTSLPDFLRVGTSDANLTKFLRRLLFSPRHHVREPRAA